jgi:hypothetical protein
MAPQHVTTETHNLNHAGQPADGLIAGAAAIRPDPGPNFGLGGPSPGGAVWPIFLRAHAAMDAPCVIARSGWDLRLSEFSANGTGWHSVALFHRPSISPRSRFSAWGAGWPARPRRARSFPDSGGRCDGRHAGDLKIKRGYQAACLSSWRGTKWHKVATFRRGPVPLR